MTEIVQATPWGYCTFCDSIRQEVDGKKTYVGVYDNVAHFPTLPATWTTFQIEAVLFEAFGEGKTDIVFSVYLPGGHDPIVTAQAPRSQILETPRAPHEDEKTRRRVNAIFLLNTVPLTEQGYIRVTAAVDGRTYHLGRLFIYSPPAPTV